MNNKLIFLMSQPRSGSTLLQKILCKNKEIYSRSEPWIMLNPSYILKEYGTYAEYDSILENKAVKDFITDIPNGSREYFVRQLSSMYFNVYNSFLKEYDKNYFLDKTPRYYLIKNELMEIFPNAKYILLLRNPLDVLNSIITSWTRDNWQLISKYKIDLIDAIDVNIDILENNNKIFHTIKYEELIVEPEYIIKKLSTFIEIDYDGDMLSYQNNNENKWNFGDQKTYEKKKIENNNYDGWKNNLLDPQQWRIFYDYLNIIGKEKFDKLGYSFDDSLKYIRKNIPLDIYEIFHNTIGLQEIFDNFSNKEVESSYLNNEIDKKEKVLQEYSISLIEKEKVIQCLLEVKSEYDKLKQNKIIKILNKLGLIK